MKKPESAENIVEEKLLQVRYTNVFDRILMEIQLIHLFDNFGLGFFANLTISCQNNVDGRNYTRCIENKISVPERNLSSTLSFTASSPVAGVLYFIPASAKSNARKRRQKLFVSGDHVIQGDTASDRRDPYDLNRFISAQEGVYEHALAELRDGLKRSHWMWYIFPQIEGLGHSPTSRHYSIKSLEEARQYLAHPVLGPRLKECAEVVMAVQVQSATDIFGHPDDWKLQSSMTLFELVSGPQSVFGRVLDKYYQGKRDTKTLQLVGKH